MYNLICKINSVPVRRHVAAKRRRGERYIMRTKENYQKFIDVLKEELVPAMGCTEPIAIAYCAAKARDVLGSMPERAEISVSGNIVKNAKSVVVPHTGGMRGIKAAFAAGILAGDAGSGLQVISNVSEEQYKDIARFECDFPADISVPPEADIFDISVRLYCGKNTSFVRLAGDHTNIVRIERDGKVLFDKPLSAASKSDRSFLSIENILGFADSVDIVDVQEVIGRQISYNMAIAEEGLRGDYGANIGKTILRSYQPDIKTTAKAYAAAASDARMNGCELPVVINSGSGNQGITCSVPVIVYARNLGLSEERLYRALCVSNLITVHLKFGIGTLSAYCGAVAAGAGAAGGITYLLGGDYSEVAHTLTNALAIDSGIICDGAKASCAAKIATAVDGGLLGMSMYEKGNQFFAGDGIVKKGVEETIRSVSRLAHDGMRETDKEIIKIMLESK